MISAISATPAPCQRPRLRRFSWLVWACLGLVMFMALPVDALAQGKAYALGRVPNRGGALPDQ